MVAGLEGVIRIGDDIVNDFAPRDRDTRAAAPGRHPPRRPAAPARGSDRWPGVDRLLTWQDIDLANGRISVRDSKTEAGIRLVDILPALRDELTRHRGASSCAKPADLVFPTSSGSRRDKDNARERVIRPVVAHADALLGRRVQQSLPPGVTAHKLRHTFTSILFARGEDPPYVMAQLGHTDPAFTLRVYAHAMRRDAGDKERLKALIEGREWAPMGTTGLMREQRRPGTTPPIATKPPEIQGFLRARPAGFEPAASRSGGERSIH
jgi:Phage integrase family